MIHHVDQRTIDQLYQEYAPVFILTTGRSGSVFLNRLLNLSSKIISYHEPQPTLQYFSNYAFHNQNDRQVLLKIIDTTRMELILNVQIQNKIYVESNQCMTFFAPAIQALFKQSKFIHIIRHPGNFVRSSLGKGWHRNDSIWESGRVRMEDTNKWDTLTQIEKLSWVWLKTNQYIDDFGAQIENNRFLSFRFEDLLNNTQEVRKLFSFIGVSKISTRSVGKVQKLKVNELTIGANEPPNMKKISNVPAYNKWDESDKDNLRKIVGDLAKRYNYDI